MKDMNYFIEALKLEPHIEGGWYKETYRSCVKVDGNVTASSIYFLLSEGNFSALHQLESDEVWYHHYGSATTIAAIDTQGQLHQIRLGNDLAGGDVLQFTVSAGWIFGSFVDEGFSVVGCMVSPGFDFDQFKLWPRQALCERYPQHEAIIKALTRD